jgi:hypothetical protein
LRSSPQSIPDEFITPFNRIVHEQHLSMKAAFGGLKHLPIKRLRWVYHHLLYDITTSRVLGTSSLGNMIAEVQWSAFRAGDAGETRAAAWERAQRAFWRCVGHYARALRSGCLEILDRQLQLFDLVRTLPIRSVLSLVLGILSTM